jgi:hypothetical protein
MVERLDLRFPTPEERYLIAQSSSPRDWTEKPVRVALGRSAVISLCSSGKPFLPLCVPWIGVSAFIESE